MSVTVRRVTVGRGTVAFVAREDQVDMNVRHGVSGPWSTEWYKAGVIEIDQHDVDGRLRGQSRERERDGLSNDVTEQDDVSGGGVYFRQKTTITHGPPTAR